MHPASLVLASILLLPVYGMIVFTAATRKEPLWMQLPYLFGMAMLAISIAATKDFWLSGIIFAFYCGLTCSLIHLLGKSEQ